MKTISTKKALAASLLSLLVCVSMLVGSTFAWFTDTAKTGVNTIQAGTLDVALEMKDNDGNWVSAEGETLQFLVEGKIPDEGTQILWEPGCTYELPALRVVNNGNLALKYQVVITGIQGDAKLNEAITWTITGTEDGKLTAGAFSGEIKISGHMKEDAGNDYQGLSIGGVSVTVYAAQDAVESDSKDNRYDADAQYPVQAAVAIDAPEKIEVRDTEGNVTDTYYQVKKDVVLYSPGKVEVAAGEEKHVAVIKVPAATKLSGSTEMLTMDITQTVAPDGFQIADDMQSTTYEIKVPEVAADNTVGITVELYVGVGLIHPTVYHNGTAMDAADYSYDAASGIMTIRTATFSPFTVVSEKPAASVGGTAYTSLEEAIANAAGAEIVLNKDASTKSGLNIANDLTLNLNGYTWTVGDNTKVVDGASLHIFNGKVLNETFAGHFDVRPGTTTDGTVSFTNVAFTGMYNTGRGTRGSSTTHTDYVLKYTPELGGHVSFSFTGCSFDNAAIQFSGLSGKNGTFDVTFEDCHFNALSNSSLVELKSYLEGTFTFRDCSFFVTATSNFSIIDGNYGRAGTVAFEGSNTFDGVIATPTGADKAGTPEEIKIFSDKLNVKVCSVKTVTGLDTVTVAGVIQK